MKYNNPPIQEAIFDIRIERLKNITTNEFEKIHDQLIDKYPNKKKQINFVGKIELQGEKPVTQIVDGTEITGIFFSNEDNSRIVQFRLDGFSFNWVRSYNDWDNLTNEAFRLWNIYFSNFNPVLIVRIALRYINRINIPFPFPSFQEYIVNMPPIPKNLPQVFNTFFMQTEIPCDPNGTGIIINETFEKPINNNLAFILDFDAYRLASIDSNLETLKSEFEKLRILKNNTFESCITDKTRKLFN